MPADTWTDFPVSSLVPGFNPTPPLNFDQITEIPGNIAGGISHSAFGSDRRVVTGAIRVHRQTDGTGKTVAVSLQTDLDFVVEDAIDFCPGGHGAPLEQQVTVPLSRLEAMGWTSDLGFEVRFDAPTERTTLTRAEISRCWTVPDLPTYLGGGAFIDERGIIRQGPGPKF